MNLLLRVDPLTSLLGTALPWGQVFKFIHFQAPTLTIIGTTFLYSVFHRLPLSTPFWTNQSSFYCHFFIFIWEAAVTNKAGGGDVSCWTFEWEGICVTALSRPESCVSFICISIVITCQWGAGWFPWRPCLLCRTFPIIYRWEHWRALTSLAATGVAVCHCPASTHHASSLDVNAEWIVSGWEMLVPSILWNTFLQKSW